MGRSRLPRLAKQATARGYEAGTSARTRAGTRGHGKSSERPDSQEKHAPHRPSLGRQFRGSTSMVRRRSTVRVRQRACAKALQIGLWCCLRWRDSDDSRVRDGYILGLAGIRGHSRRLGSYATMCSRHSIATRSPKSSWEARVCVARTDAELPPSFDREGVAAQSASLPTTSANSHRHTAGCAFPGAILETRPTGWRARAIWPSRPTCSTGAGS